MTDVSESTVIACTLGVSDFRQRATWIADLNRTALRSHRRNGLQLELVYAPSALDRVREMVAREQTCCAFLSFSLREDRDGIQLVIEAPEASRDMLDTVFEPFEAPNPASSGCGCSLSNCR